MSQKPNTPNISDEHFQWKHVEVKFPLDHQSSPATHILRIDQQRVLLTRKDKALLVNIETGTQQNLKDDSMWGGKVYLVGQQVGTHFKLITLGRSSYALYDSKQDQWTQYKDISNVQPSQFASDINSLSDGDLIATWGATDHQYRDSWYGIYRYKHTTDEWLPKDIPVYSNHYAGKIVELSNRKQISIAHGCIGWFKDLKRKAINIEGKLEGFNRYVQVMSNDCLMIINYEKFKLSSAHTDYYRTLAYVLDPRQKKLTPIFRDEFHTGYAIAHLSDTTFALIGGMIQKPRKWSSGDIIQVEGELFEIVKDDILVQMLSVRRQGEDRVRKIRKSLVNQTDIKENVSTLKLFNDQGFIDTDPIQLPEKKMMNPQVLNMSKGKLVMMSDEKLWLLTYTP